MGIEVTRQRTIGGYVVAPGLRMVHDTRAEDVSFRVAVVCDAVEPRELWHGEVTFGGVRVLETDRFPTHDQAGRAGVSALAERLASVLTP